MSDDELKRRLIGALSRPDPFSSYRSAVVDAVHTAAPDGYEIRELDGSNPLDKRVIIVTPGFEMPSHVRHELDRIAREYLPLGCRVEFDFSSDSFAY